MLLYGVVRLFDSRNDTSLGKGRERVDEPLLDLRRSLWPEPTLRVWWSFVPGPCALKEQVGMKCD